MNAKEFEILLDTQHLDACEPAQEWQKGKSLQEVWETCERGDWMLWLAKCMQDKEGWHNLKQITLAKAKCARLVIHLMKDKRSKKAVKVAEQFGLGNATRNELDAAAADADAAADAAAADAYADAAVAADAAAAAADAYADAAVAAAYAAYAADAKKKEILKQCADICREYLPIDYNKVTNPYLKEVEK